LYVEEAFKSNEVENIANIKMNSDEYHYFLSCPIPEAFYNTRNIVDFNKG
jgi:hypothetical protein